MTTWTGLSLAGPPAAPRSDSLDDVLKALGASVESIERLWPSAGASSPPVIRRGQPASFLLVIPAGLDHARLASVWLDGVEVGAE